MKADAAHQVKRWKFAVGDMVRVVSFRPRHVRRIAARSHRYEGVNYYRLNVTFAGFLTWREEDLVRARKVKR